MPWTYMLRCGDGSYYVGSTRNLEQRLDQHSSGLGSRYTSTRLPVELVWCIEYDNVGDAYCMEKRIQGWSRAKREALIAGDYERLPALSRNHRRDRS
ncbi:GIY-YIG nuclease family protein [Calidifontibacter sp. DB0510]|uniref:GIY-YIG nuclease family protein n=1 Tax=Metallococcus carri TaxID=1656884 RepID=A0A967B1D8_9MICO|nr:GIY-YIG nuclease family protein [Metallococcus carri]NHN57014.1 GIY-YIG nuclease family protein [Metallococcus carri]NOP39117.1 GIY-YIG nuclease family protein [Calidifontibacter sp. DB2511S]